MSDSTRYFQLTPDILVEYTYHHLSEGRDQAGDVEHVKDLEDDSYIVSNGYCGTKSFYWSMLGERFVLPINKSESRFVQCVKPKSYPREGESKYNYVWEWSTDFGGELFAPSTGNDDKYDDILVDKITLHFSSRNYMGSYDGLIISAYVYDTRKNKVGLLSQYIKKTDDPNIDHTPVLINQKMYTTHQDFYIPNATGLFDSEEISDALPGNQMLRQKLFSKYDIMENSPLLMNIYGVKSTFSNNGHEYYNTERLNTIYIPILDKSNRLSVAIDEAEDGDYFDIYPVIDNGRLSFSDYIYNISDGHPEQYIVFYELELWEYYADRQNVVRKDLTHREQYIINAAQEQIESGDTVLEINEKELDGVMYYRPIIIHSASIESFVINVRLNIINTYDNTTIVKKAAILYEENPEDNGNNDFYKVMNKNPKKYGKRMQKIFLGEIPAQVNVYNKKPDIDIDGVKITNASSNVKIENHQHSVIGFIECANVGVSIEQIPTELLKEN
jgi:hypothetical protein